MSVLQQFRVDGKVALITGAGRGIGLAIAQALAEAGAKVAIQDIDHDIAAAEAGKLVDAGGQAIALGGDATKLADVEGWITQTREALGDVDILVNNVSIQASYSLEEWPIEEAEKILRTNVIGPMRLIQLAVPHMRERKWGRILNVGSIQGIKGYPGMLPYSAGKAALHNMTRALARGLGQHGITCNAIAPGIFNTLRNSETFGKHDIHDFKDLPLRRAGLPDDCAAISLLLCSDAGKYITGDCVSVDGGMHL